MPSSCITSCPTPCTVPNSNVHRSTYIIPKQPSDVLISVTVSGRFDMVSLCVPSVNSSRLLVLIEAPQQDGQCVLSPFLRGLPLLSYGRIVVSSEHPETVSVSYKVDHLNESTFVDLVTFRSMRHPQRGPLILLESGETIQYCYTSDGWTRVNRNEDSLPCYTGPQYPHMFVPVER